MKELLDKCVKWKHFILFSFIGAILFGCGAWFVAWLESNRTARVAAELKVNEIIEAKVDEALGPQIDELSKILDGFRKIQITQTNNQEVHIPNPSPTEAELRASLTREVLKAQGKIEETEK